MLNDLDPIYEKLDRWHDSESFDKIIYTILEIPREEWSNKLHFRLISAYNNKKDFTSALEELVRVRPNCRSPQDFARFYYMNGYMNFMCDREMLALSFYKLGMEADPENTSGLDLEKECRECMDYIEEDLSELHDTAAEIVEKLAKRCAGRSDRLDSDEPSFAVWLGYLFSVRVLPGMKRCIGVDNVFTEFESEEREAVLKCLAEKYHITSRETLMEFIRNDRYCNLTVMVNDALADISGSPRFDVNILDVTGKQVYENTVVFVRPIAEFIPKAGVLAWDINERNGLVRYAYSCGLLSREELVPALEAMSQSAKENFTSAEEYIRSLIFGCAVYAFDADRWNIRGAVDFFKTMSDLLINSRLPDLEWKKPEKRG